MSGIVATSLITLVPFILWKINDSNFKKPLEYTEIISNTELKVYLCQGIIFLEDTLLRGIVLTAVLKFLKRFSA